MNLQAYRRCEEVRYIICLAAQFLPPAASASSEYWLSEQSFWLLLRCILCGYITDVCFTIWEKPLLRIWVLRTSSVSVLCQCVGLFSFWKILFRTLHMNSGWLTLGSQAWRIVWCFKEFHSFPVTISPFFLHQRRIPSSPFQWFWK